MVLFKPQRGESALAVLISMASAGIAFWALQHSINTEMTLGTKNELHSFDGKWKGGTFQCVNYLLNLPEKEKVFAFKGKSHTAPEEHKLTLENCVPKYADEINKLSGTKGYITVSSKYAYEAKEQVRTSFNALDILVESFDDIEKCKAWSAVNGVFKKDETELIVDEWRKYGNCGSNCFSSVGAIYEKGEFTELNKLCS